MEIRSNLVGDLPLLSQILKQSKVVERIDDHFPTHPNRKGPSVGKTVMVWLLYIISENDHRLSHVESWVEQSIDVLRWLCDAPHLESSHFSDDYLGSLLERFSVSSQWLAYEAAQNQALLQIFDLEQSLVRLDATNVKSFRLADGLFQIGHSKQRRSDLPQIKLMLASIDPLAMPIASYIVSGQRADDGLYIPAIDQARQSLKQQGLLYVGDTKLGNQANFAYLAGSQNWYLCPLSLRQFSEEQLAQAIDIALTNSHSIKKVQWHEQTIAHVYELPSVWLSNEEQSLSWSHRHLLVKSLDLAKRMTEGLDKRLKKAQQEILERFVPKQGRRIFMHIDQAQTFIDRVLKRYKVKTVLKAQLQLVADSKRSRKLVHCQLKIDQVNLQQLVQLHGWRVYATNCPEQQLSAEQIVIIYRQEYRIEQNFHQLLNKITQLMPIFLSKQNRIQGLIRLLLLALKFVAIIQDKVRKTLHSTQDFLTRLIPGNPRRKVLQPTTSLILRAFKTIRLYMFQLPRGQIQYQVEPLDNIQLKILDLLNLDRTIYLHPFMSKNLDFY